MTLSEIRRRIDTNNIYIITVFYVLQCDIAFVLQQK